MADINECFQLLKYRANKAGYNGYISPDDFNLLWPRAERRYFNKRYEKYAATQEFSESLSVFKSDPLPIVVDSQGKYTKPADILHIDSIRHTYEGIEQAVERVEDDRLANRLSSYYDAPTTQFPIYTEYNTYLQFYPITLASATLVYLQDLPKSVWAYTLTSNRPVYDSANSVQPNWKDTDIDEIIYIVGDDIGINMRDQEYQAFSNRKIQTGV